MSELRLAFVHSVCSLQMPVAQACRKFSISRKTGYKWLARYHQEPDRTLADRSRRPCHSPRHTLPAVEQPVLEVRDRYGWGARKVRAYLAIRAVGVPSVRTVTRILERHGRIGPDPPPERSAVQRFERSTPNELWQLDFKGPLEVARRKVHPFGVLDDHSRYCLALRACLDLTMATAWAILWETFGQVGLPEAILCDNAFNVRGPQAPGVSWFDSMLLRLDIRPIHGRPYHPQTQGKIESFNGSLQRELWPRVRRDAVAQFDQDLDRYRVVYNTLRPHEALADQVPLSRWMPSPRKRPAAMPEVAYPAGSVVHKVSTVGDVRWQGYRILAGRGLTGQYVRIEERTDEVAVFYARRQIRGLAKRELRGDTML